MNLEQARFNMIEQQIRTWEVLDQRVLDLLGTVRREEFVPAAYRRLAFADINIPLGHGEVMMAPKVEARLLQSLQVNPGDEILEVGTGSGYLCACLARLGASVVSVDIHPDFTTAAAANLARAGVRNVRLQTGDASAGWQVPARYDAIAVTGSLPVYGSEFEKQLRIGGRLFAIVGEAPVMAASLVTRTGEHAFSRETLFETVLPALIGAPRPRKFVL